MMKKTNSARKVSNTQFQDILANTSPVAKEKLRVKMGVAAGIDDGMKVLKMNKSTLATKLGRQPSEVTKWVSGTHNFTLDTLVEVAHALNMTVSTLIPVASPKRQKFTPITLHLRPKRDLQDAGHLRTIPRSQMAGPTTHDGNFVNKNFG
jgi:transcriptional regulator with XRE-family HTH domain